MNTDMQSDGQAVVAEGVQRFVDNLATTISSTLSIASEKVALEAAVVRQRYKFQAFQSVLGMIHEQRDQLRLDYDKASDPTEQEIIGHQLGMLAVQLNQVLTSAGVPAKAAITAANKATAIEHQPIEVKPQSAGKKRAKKKSRRR